MLIVRFRYTAWVKWNCSRRQDWIETTVLCPCSFGANGRKSIKSSQLYTVL